MQIFTERVIDWFRFVRIVSERGLSNERNVNLPIPLGLLWKRLGEIQVNE